jgi:hypothetical protein
MSSRHAAIELDFGDGTYTFRLAIDGIEEIEEKRDTSLYTIAARLSPELRSPRLKDISETLRIGLIGGGMKPVDALALVRRYVDERPVDENRDVAYAVVMAGLARVHPGEFKEMDEGEAPAAGPSGSTSPPSTPEPH